MSRLLIILAVLLSLAAFSQTPDPGVKLIECSSILKAGDVEHAISVGKVKKIILKCYTQLPLAKKNNSLIVE